MCLLPKVSRLTFLSSPAIEGIEAIVDIGVIHNPNSV